MVDRIIARFLRLNIAKKMVFGYLTLAIVIFLISAFTLSSLDRLNDINSAIIKTDVPLIDAADRMIDNLLAQELYARRYVILKSPEMLALFWEKSKGFDGQIERINTLPGTKDISVTRLIFIHSIYNKLLVNGGQYLKDTSSHAARKYDAEVKKNQEELIGLIKNISSAARQDQNKKTILTSRIGTAAFKVIGLLCIIGLISSIGATVLITRSIAGPISQLKIATQEIALGRFDHIPDIKNQDELGDLSNAFMMMTQRLKRLEEMYLDASPLTRLPGSIAIENVLKKRLETGAPLAFCLIDMDNFKAYNDRYGYAKGSELIKATAKIIEKCVAENGTSDDFVGHIGGDDYVLITTPDQFRKTCSSVIEAFDKKISEFYDPDDLKRGCINGKTRQGQGAEFPIMTVSIAVVTNLQRKLTNPIQVGELAAELKEYAKSISESVYVVDRRRRDMIAEYDENVIRFPQKGSSQKDT